MSWKDSCSQFIKKYGPAAKAVAGAVLNVAVPGSGALISLVDKAFDTAQDSAHGHWEAELQRASSQNADELVRLGSLMELLTGDLAKLCDNAFAFHDQPDDIEDIVRRALSADRGLQAGLRKLDTLVNDFACIKEQQKRLLDGNDEMLPIMRRLSRVADYFAECELAGATPGDLRELLLHRQTIMIAIHERKPKQARAAVAAIEGRANHGDTQLFKAGIALVEQDFHGVQAAVGKLSRRQPKDAEMAALHQRATVIATGMTPRVPPVADVSAAPNLQVGDTLGGWKLEARLGSGGWGQVFKAVKGTQTVALKVMHAQYSRDEAFCERFRGEIMALSRLPRHASLVRILGFNKSNETGCWYLMMDFIDGPTLEQMLHEKGKPMSAGAAQRVFGEVAAGLGLAHAADIVHRDIKPGNLIWSKEKKRLVLVDFGLAVHLEDLGQTKIGGMTLMFAAPEQTRGLPADAKSDVFSLAATMYFALLYDKPDLRNPVHFDVDETPELLREVLAKAMEANPRRRYAQCGDLHAALAAAEKVIEALEVIEPTPAKKPARKAGDLITNSIGMKMAWVPPGKFLMGSPKNEPERQDNETQHEVELTQGFYMSVCPVTQEEYSKVMKATPSYFCASGGGKDKVGGMDTKRFPVEQVSWRDALDFCRRLSETEGKNYDLPTEAEWEYACRAGKLTAYSFGAALSSRQANFNLNLSRTSTVGSYPANALGLFDMHGNVWEWCKDCYDAAYYAKSPKTDPECTSGENRVLRGGSWYLDCGDCRSSYRYDFTPGSRLNVAGFRFVLSCPEDD